MNWLFLRGWSREARHWMNFPEVFEQKVAGSRVHCLDLPGFGNSPSPHSPVSIHGIVKELRKEWLEIKSKTGASSWGILGISLGGMITAEWITSQPLDFKKAVIINSSASNLSPVGHRLRWGSLFGLVQSAFQSTPQKREAKILSIVSNKFTEAPYEGGSLNLQEVIRQLIAAISFRLKKRSPIDCLFLASEGDRLLKLEACKKMAECLDAELCIHPNAGHDLPLDDPEWCAQQVANWLESKSRVQGQ